MCYPLSRSRQLDKLSLPHLFLHWKIRVFVRSLFVIIPGRFLQWISLSSCEWHYIDHNFLLFLSSSQDFHSQPRFLILYRTNVGRAVENDANQASRPEEFEWAELHTWSIFLFNSLCDFYHFPSSQLKKIVEWAKYTSLSHNRNTHTLAAVSYHRLASLAV